MKKVFIVIKFLYSSICFIRAFDSYDKAEKFMLNHVQTFFVDPKAWVKVSNTEYRTEIHTICINEVNVE